MKYIVWSNAGTTWRAAWIKRCGGISSAYDLCCEKLQEDMLKQEVWVPCSAPPIETLILTLINKDKVEIFGAD